MQLADRKDITLKIEPICYDAFVFMVHHDNPVNDLTIEEVRDIYSGKITNWQQVGGNDEPIMAFQREKGTESQIAMENMVMENQSLQSPLVAQATRSKEVAAEYINRMNSLGYTFLFYVDNLYNDEHIKKLSINGIEPTIENIRGTTNLFWWLWKRRIISCLKYGK